jgi:hypothetical protein
MSGLNGLPMQLLASVGWVIPLIQIIFVVHALKTGRNWYWMWIIICFPFLGAAVYFFVEFLPSYPRFTFDTVLNVLVPGRERQNLENAVADTATVQNRRALGDYYLSHGQAQKALEQFRECVKGVFKEDGEMNLRLCSALVETGQFQEAQAILEGLRKKKTAYETSQRDVLYGRVLEGLGRKAEAIQVYEDVLGRFGSEVEGCCHLARLYAQEGQEEKARRLYEDLLKRAKRFSPHYRNAMRVWIKAAKAGLRELTAS